MATKKIDYNSNVNQDIKSKFVHREVQACVTSLVEYVLTSGEIVPEPPFTFDDIENYYTYPEWSQRLQGEDLYFPGGTEEAKDEFLTKFDDLVTASEDLYGNEEISEETHERNLELIQEAKEEFEALDQEGQEIFEWWMVTNWLGEKLKEKGKAVVSDGLNTYWGRTTTGQAILLDHVISEICSEMEILEGQTNIWAK